MADYPQLPVESRDHRQMVIAINRSHQRLNKPVMPVYTVAELAALPQSLKAELAFASDGLKAGEAPGTGSGVLVFYDGSNWIAVDTGLTVAA